MPSAARKPFRPPAVPLLACDPYFSVWSFTDKLTDEKTKHWSGSNMPLTGMLRVDGQTFRFLSADPGKTPAMEQKSLEVLPTRTIYRFEAAGVALALTFTTPALPHDLDLLAWPVTYVNFELKSLDGRSHEASVYLDALADLGAANPQQPVAWSRLNLGNFSVLRAGTVEQPVLQKTHCERIDWGYLYLATPSEKGRQTVANAEEARNGFIKDGSLPVHDDVDTPRPTCQGWPVLACTLDFGAVNAPASRSLVFAYDDLFGVELFNRKLRSYWRKKHADIGSLLREAFARHAEIEETCAAYDEELMADLRASGGEAYARLCALSFRQCTAAQKLCADYDGKPLHFPKENYSGGFIATVDVHYPAAPFPLLFNPELLKAELTPVFDYVRSGNWPYPFAPHDLGDYPKANGQTYGGTHLPLDKQMPVEECGNMLLMVAALAKIEGHAEYAKAQWPILEQWAGYLLEKGFDPENQLCTDDFMGHLAHNANLSIKAILGIGSFGMLCEMTGKREDAAHYTKQARAMAEQWRKMACDGEHYRLAFDKPGTWSQKYNLVWDKLLGLNLFPAEIARTEIASYLKRQQPYGLPLDSRGTVCKNDWSIWSATLAEARVDFEALVEPLYTFAAETPSRVPLTDCYWCDKGVIRNFQARSVVGGFFIKLLADEALWTKWANRRRA
ncbi:MAG: DUF4965 domain-containing protein [Planctomycetes bacterium]|nr:DUF4965 domain-containing protein [Planctomycetota bacterium]